MKDSLVEVLERIAKAQEQLVEIATEARAERLKLSDTLKERMRAGFAASRENEQPQP